MGHDDVDDRGQCGGNDSHHKQVLVALLVGHAAVGQGQDNRAVVGQGVKGDLGDVGDPGSTPPDCRP